MTTLNDFPITRKWPAQHPDRLQFYGVASPNGVKVSIMLEETQLPYEAHWVNFEAQEQQSPEYATLNPYKKIPAIIDPNGPDGQPLGLFESGAILIYLAEKMRRFLPGDSARRYEAIQWLMFQMSAIGPMFGQVGFFYKFAGKEFEDKRPRDHYVAQARKCLTVVNDRLATREWMMGSEYSIVDIAVFPMVRNLVEYYGAGELVKIDEFQHVLRALKTFVARPAVARGLTLPSKNESGLSVK